MRLLTRQKSAIYSSSLRPQTGRRSWPPMISRRAWLMCFSFSRQFRNREWQLRKISLRTQLQGASGPCLVVLPRNPSPWQCVQVSFAAAIVSERFHSKFTNVSSRLLLNLHKFTEFNFSHLIDTLRNITRISGGRTPTNHEDI